MNMRLREDEGVTDTGQTVREDDAPLPDRYHRGTNQTGMRQLNERLVLTLLRRLGPMPKSAIARMTGLSAQTVSVIMRALEVEGLLIREEPVRGKVGQPSVPMALNPDGAYFVGLKLGRRSADIVLTGFTGEILGQVHSIWPWPEPDAVAGFTARSIRELTAGLSPAQRARIAGLGVAMPFQMWEWAEAMGAPASAIEAWRHVDIRAELSAATGLPVYVQNDASAACNAELVFAPEAAPRDFLYFYIAFFAGGGIVLNGALYPGRTGNAGALGSMPVTDRTGRLCQLIDVASLRTLEKALTARGLPAESLYASSEDWGVDPAFLDDWIEGAAHGLAQAILASASVIDFSAAIIDGWMPEEVRARLVAATTRHLGSLNQAGIEPLEIREGSVGFNARALGAATLPLAEKFLAGQTHDTGDA